MPRIGNVNLLGVLLAAIAMFFVGFVFYGLLFTDIWMSARGYTPEMGEGQNPAWMGAGFLIELILAFGIGWLLKQRGLSGMGECVAFAVMLVLLIGFPLIAYEYVYGFYHSVPGVLVDWGHKLVTFSVGAAILSFFD